MDPAERKTLWLFKLISSGLIFLILMTLLYLSNSQKEQPPLTSLASSQIEVFESEQQIPLEKLPWAKESFHQAFTNGQFNYVNYWAEWCEPCLKEIPILQKMSEQLSFVNLIFVNVDFPENQDKAKKFWQENVENIESFYIKNSKAIFQYTRGLPYHQVYDKNNNLFLHFTRILEDPPSPLYKTLKNENSKN